MREIHGDAKHAYGVSEKCLSLGQSESLTKKEINGGCTLISLKMNIYYYIRKFGAGNRTTFLMVLQEGPIDVIHFKSLQ